MKSKNKTEIKEIPIEKIEVKTKMPSILEGTIDVNFSSEELSTLTNLLSISASVFQAMALNAAEANQDDRFNILSKRHALLVSFANKFAGAVRLGEPVSREIH
jgi:hypothetical protein